MSDRFILQEPLLLDIVESFWGEGQLEIRKRKKLPHWERQLAIYHVVFRQADSLPVSVTNQFLQEREELLRKADLPIEDRKRLEYLVSQRIQDYLDAGHGSCLMSQPEVGFLLSQALKHFDQKRYSIFAYAVMPNHVHAVLQPFADQSLNSITHSWKSYTGHEIKKIHPDHSTIWMSESYDNIIRSEQALRLVVQYVRENPSKAGLQDWPWVYVAPQLSTLEEG